MKMIGCRDNVSLALSFPYVVIYGLIESQSVNLEDAKRSVACEALFANHIIICWNLASVTRYRSLASARDVSYSYFMMDMREVLMVSMGRTPRDFSRNPLRPMMDLRTGPQVYITRH